MHSPLNPTANLAALRQHLYFDSNLHNNIRIMQNEHLFNMKWPHFFCIPFKIGLFNEYASVFTGSEEQLWSEHKWRKQETTCKITKVQLRIANLSKSFIEFIKGFVVVRTLLHSQPYLRMYANQPHSHQQVFAFTEQQWQVSEVLHATCVQTVRGKQTREREGCHIPDPIFLSEFFWSW